MYCIYGTVFNNVNTVEDSIKSVWDPEYTIVITDNYSTDGTWEKLQELRKEYNLVLLRLKSSRGKGKDYALRHCPANTMTAYFDLDTVYNENFHKIVKWTPKDKITSSFGIIGLRETLLSKGGWRDLNVGEDFELFARIGFDYSIPVIIGKNWQGFDRERRYAKGLGYYVRRYKNFVDLIRGWGLNWSDLNKIYLFSDRFSVFYKLGIITAFLVAKFKGIYRYSAESNGIKVIRESIEKIVHPSQLGINDKYLILEIFTVFTILSPNLENYIESKLREEVGRFKKYICSDGIIRYVKSDEGLKLALLGTITPNVECKEV
ncbi:glycosyltransferase [Sulfolobus sp. E11-6]|uniref:glycosyltransferase n=1 Tax=Sulfolobus sp. E11-6 TaxID=2663020 RepID=UPI00129615C4|nr:glycosyltransferase [Sulfolobus sp. E11-6]QGA68895.1 glycosyltransferase [Sulfolobus sp. E11-6]